MATMQNPLMKSRSPQTLHIKTVILLGNFSFGLINIVNMSTMFFIQCFLNLFIFFIKNMFLTGFFYF